jgi:hypothetical protein
VRADVDIAHAFCHAPSIIGASMDLPSGECVRLALNVLVNLFLERQPPVLQDSIVKR